MTKMYIRMSFVHQGHSDFFAESGSIFECWKNIFLIFCAIHNVTIIDATSI